MATFPESKVFESRGCDDATAIWQCTHQCDNLAGVRFKKIWYSLVAMRVMRVLQN